MPKVDSMSRSVSVHVGSRITFFQEDASYVLGIPCGGKDVWDASLDKSQNMRNKIESIIGVDKENTSPIKAAAMTLQSLAGQPLSGDEVNVFKIAFVVFVVCMIVDSNNPGEKESVNFWPALTNPDIIHTFNWSNYVLDAVFSACAASKIAMRRNAPYNPPAGTTLFLQVRFFDCLLSFHLSLIFFIFPFCTTPTDFLSRQHGLRPDLSTQEQHASYGVIRRPYIIKTCSG
jgi:hypothetical protein